MEAKELKTKSPGKMKLQMSGAQAVVHSLLSEGVDLIFGYPGGAIMPVYDALYDHLDPKSIPLAILILGDYQYKAAFVADAEINLVACLTELMVELEYK